MQTINHERPADRFGKAMNQAKTIDIILPTLNRGYILKHALKSITNQTSSNWNLVIIDNASTDNTAVICAEFISDDRISYYQNSETLPIYDNWEHAFTYVKSEYYILFSDDDLMHPKFVESVSSCFNDETDVIIVDRLTNAPVDDQAVVTKKLIGRKSAEFGETQVINPFDISKQYGTAGAVFGNLNLNLHPSMIVMKTQVVRDIANEFGRCYPPVAQDFFLGVVLGLRAKKVLKVNRPMVIIGGYRKAPYCEFSNKFDYFGMKFEDALVLLNKYSEDLPMLTDELKKYWKLPYFYSNILKQTFLTIKMLEDFAEPDFQVFMKFLQEHENTICDHLFDEMKTSYQFCTSMGDSRIPEFDTTFLTTAGRKIALRSTIAKYVKIVLMFVNKNQNNVISLLICKVHNLLSKENSWTHYIDLDDALKKLGKK